MKELIDKLNYYTKLYDEGKPEISDKEWDELYFKLVEMEKETGIIYPNSPTQSISYEVKNSLEKVQHNHEMLSLAKSKDWNEFLNYFFDINPGKDVIGMLKLDGLTCSLRYINGRLVSAETRGNGIEGEDILHNAKVIASIPQTISYKEELIIDGEIICTYNDFLEFVDDYKNPRNFASGSIRLLDSSECAKRNLTFVCWNVVKGFSEEKYFMTKLVMLAELGFLITPYTSSFDWDAKEFLINQAKGLGYPIDGLVGRFDDIEFGNSLGSTSHHSRAAFAFKFYDEEHESELLDIEYEVSRNGILTPVAIFSPVEIEGSEVSRASLSNLSVMEETLGRPYIGQKVYITKRNAIIPKIEHAEQRGDLDEFFNFSDINIPSVCPVCGEPVKVETSDAGIKTLVCSNEACSCRIINIFDHYCGRSGMNIKGLSKATLEKLLDWNFISNIADLYSLSNFRKEWIKKSGFGPTSVDKILKAIEESKKCGLAQFLVALGIPLIGPSAAKELEKKFKNWTEFFNSVTQKFNYSTLPNFGFEMSKAILNFNFEEANFIATNYLSFGEKEEEKTELTGLTFVITGSLTKPRKEYQSLIESLGGKVTGSVSRNTNYLICNDKNSNSGKSKTAKDLGIPVVTEEEFFEILKKL